MVAVVDFDSEQEERSYEVPNNIELEMAVVGAVLCDPARFPSVRKWLAPEDFYRKSHQTIFTAMCDLAAQDKPPDLMLVTTQLKKTHDLAAVGGISYLTGLAAGVAYPAFAEHYAKQILDLKVARNAIHFLKDAPFKIAEAPSPSDALVSLTASLDELKRAAAPAGVSAVDIGDIADVYFEGLDAAATRGIPTGFADLEKYLQGFQPGDLILVGARPSMGKTSFALGIMRRCVDVGFTRSRQFSCLMFSVEMPKELILERFYCDLTGLTSAELRRAGTHADWCQKIAGAGGAMERVKAWPVKILDSRDKITSPDEIAAHCRDLKARGILPDLIVVDHVQKLRLKQKTQNRTAELELISNQLKELAVQLERPIILLCQLSRAPEARANKRPQLSDLRDCGALEQDADVVMFLYREEWYNPETPDKCTAEIIIAKNRCGQTGTVYLGFDPAYNRFHDLIENWKPKAPTESDDTPKKYSFRKGYGNK